MKKSELKQLIKEIIIESTQADIDWRRRNKMEADSIAQELDIPKVKKIMRFIGLSRTNYSSSSVRGYSSSSRNSYEINKYNPADITFNKISVTLFNNLIDELKKNGFGVIINKQDNPKDQVIETAEIKIKNEKIRT